MPCHNLSVIVVATPAKPTSKPYTVVWMHQYAPGVCHWSRKGACHQSKALTHYANAHQTISTITTGQKECHMNNDPGLPCRRCMPLLNTCGGKHFLEVYYVPIMLGTLA